MSSRGTNVKNEINKIEQQGLQYSSSPVGVTKPHTLGPLKKINKFTCYCDICALVHSSIIYILLEGSLNTLQTSTPPPLPPPTPHPPGPSPPLSPPSPAVVDWLRRLRNAFMPGARGPSHNRAVLKD